MQLLLYSLFWSSQTSHCKQCITPNTKHAAVAEMGPREFKGQRGVSQQPRPAAKGGLPSVLQLRKPLSQPGGLGAAALQLLRDPLQRELLALGQSCVLRQLPVPPRLLLLLGGGGGRPFLRPVVSWSASSFSLEGGCATRHLKLAMERIKKTQKNLKRNEKNAKMQKRQVV